MDRKLIAWFFTIITLFLFIGGIFVKANAAFPSDAYDHINKSLAACTVDADCGIGTEGKCISSVCRYADKKIENVGQYVEDISEELLTDNPATNMPGVIEPSEIDTSAELASICSDTTGTGVFVRNNNPTLINVTWAPTPVGSLPSPSVANKIYLVSGAGDDCDSSGTNLILCRDTGAAYEFVGFPPGVGGGTGDVTSVGNCSTGDCFTGTTGTSLTFKGTTSGSVALVSPENAGANTVTIPGQTGTICVSGNTCTGYAASTHVHTEANTMTVPGLNDTFDNVPIYTFLSTSTLTSIGCHCRGVCTTPADLLFEDGNSNAVSPNPVTCGTGTTTTVSLVSGGGAFSAGEILQVDTINTPTTGDTYVIIFTFQ